MAENVRVNVTVNGESRQAEVEPRLLLVHYLRDNLGLTGTHIGCDTSKCGACFRRNCSFTWTNESQSRDCADRPTPSF